MGNTGHISLDDIYRLQTVGRCLHYTCWHRQAPDREKIGHIAFDGTDDRPKIVRNIFHIALDG